MWAWIDMIAVALISSLLLCVAGCMTHLMWLARKDPELYARIYYYDWRK